MSDVVAKAKYLFDQDFAPNAKAAEKPIAAAELALMVAEAESKGFRQGFEAAQQEEAVIAERRTAAAFERVADTIELFARGIVAAEQRIEGEAIELAVAIAKKIVPELVVREPFGEIAALVTECFRQLASSPHMIVRVNDALHAIARERLDEIARTRGFEGRLVVIAEPEIALGDCKIEWADGGVVRDQAKIEAAISTAILRYLGARPSAVMPELGEIA
jgi:flagellar assembly protein FliH